MTDKCAKCKKEIVEGDAVTTVTTIIATGELKDTGWNGTVIKPSTRKETRKISIYHDEDRKSVV